jgi:hypothetical protein
MLGSKVLGLIVLLVALAAVCAASATSKQVAPEASFHSCPDMKQRYTNNIYVKNVSCPEAKRVIVRYTEKIIDNLQHDWSLPILGYHCDLTKKDYYGDSHRCTQADQVISFRRGT